MRLSTLIVAWAAVVAALCWHPHHASALEDDWSLGGGGVFATIPSVPEATVGLGASAFARYGLTDVFNLNIGLLYSYHFPSQLREDEPRQDLHIVVPHVGIVYALDVIEVVPYVLLDATLYVASDGFLPGDDPTVGAGMLVGLGVDWRRWKTFSIGAEAAYHAFWTDISDYPAYIHVDLHISYHFYDTF